MCGTSWLPWLLSVNCGWDPSWMWTDVTSTAERWWWWGSWGKGRGAGVPGSYLPPCLHIGLYIAAFFQTRSVSMATIEAVQRWKCGRKRWVGRGWSGDIGGKKRMIYQKGIWKLTKGARTGHTCIRVLFEASCAKIITMTKKWKKNGHTWDMICTFCGFHFKEKKFKVSWFLLF